MTGRTTGPRTKRAPLADHGYPTVAEVAARAYRLAERRPGLCRVRRVGTSRAGEPLLLLSVGDGTRNHLVVAGAHANEGVGGATSLALAERVAQDETLRADVDAAWHFLLCLDPDGARLNEGGAPGPQTLFGHHQTFFRPAGEEQPEWASSVRWPGDELPETRALLDVVEELQPFLQCSLHGHDIGGSWVQFTRELPGLGESFADSAAAAGIPVEHGPFDTLLWPSPEPGVFVAPSPEVRERFPTLVEDIDQSTWGAPHRYGGMTAAVEVPMWASAQVEDRSPHPAPEAALRACAERLRRSGRIVDGYLNEAGALSPVPDDSLLRAVRAALAGCDGLADEWERLAARDTDGTLPPLTRGHLLASEGLTWRIPLRAAAMLRRILRRDPGGNAELEGRVTAFVVEQCEALQQAFDARPVPVPRQVRHQGRTVVEMFRRALELW